MKLLFFTDTHIRNTNPRNRIDNYYESAIKKLKEIRDYANNNKVDYVIHGGDLFDRPDFAIKPTSEVGKILGSFSMPIYIAVGNHDLFGYNMDTLSRTMFGLLNEFHILNKIPKEGVLLEDEEISVLLLATHFSRSIDKDKNNYIVDKEKLKYKSDYIINVAHGFLIDKPFLKSVDHTLVGEIKETDADITLSGHYHNGFDTLEMDGKYFSNPGAMMRITNSLSELNRKPKFLEIIITKKGIEIKDKYLKSAKKGEEVLDRRQLTEDKLRAERLNIFSDSIHQNINLDMLDLDSIINEISEAENFEENVKEEAMIRIEKAKETINDLDN